MALRELRENCPKAGTQLLYVRIPRCHLDSGFRTALRAARRLLLTECMVTPIVRKPASLHNRALCSCGCHPSKGVMALAPSRLYALLYGSIETNQLGCHEVSSRNRLLRGFLKRSKRCLRLFRSQTVQRHRFAQISFARGAVSNRQCDFPCVPEQTGVTNAYC